MSREWHRGSGSAVGLTAVSGSTWEGAPESVTVAYAKTAGSRAGYPSRAGHVQSCLNLPGPSGKPKYSLATDSEQVPRGKGEKNPGEGNEKNLKPHVYKQFERYAARQRESVPFAS